jgi:hypothetical protein
MRKLLRDNVWKIFLIKISIFNLSLFIHTPYIAIEIIPNMTGNVAIDVFIGLVFIFLLYSLLATIVQELLARMFNFRARMLVKAIRTMLQDRDLNLKDGRFYIWNLAKRWWVSVKESWKNVMCLFEKQEFAAAFFKQPTIKYLARSAYHSKPSYIGADNFSNTMIRLLRGADYDGIDPQMEAIRRTLFNHKYCTTREEKKVGIEPETLHHLQQLFMDAQNDIDRFKALLEAWFLHTMDRANGWYKKQTSTLLIIIGFLFAFWFNVDSIAIYRILATDKQAREEMVQLAISSRDQYARILDSTKAVNVQVKRTITTSTGDTTITVDSSIIAASDTFLQNTYNRLLTDAQKANNILGLGKPYCDTIRFLKAAIAANKECTCDSLAWYENKLAKIKGNRKWLQYSQIQSGGFETFFGWIITALAISLGAPFWFDLLNKLINLRATGSKPDHEETQRNSSSVTTKPAQVSPKDIKG